MLRPIVAINIALLTEGAALLTEGGGGPSCGGQATGWRPRHFFVSPKRIATHALMAAALRALRLRAIVSATFWDTTRSCRWLLT